MIAPYDLEPKAATQPSWALTNRGLEGCVCELRYGRQIGAFEIIDQAVVGNQANAALAASRSVGKTFDLAGADKHV